MTDGNREDSDLQNDDPREDILESGPQAGGAANIREQQGTHAAGAVPAAYVGGNDSADKPEDAADNSGHWDELGRENPVREPGDEES
ncbi:hypothetical protein GC088_14675 [Arthrobacter sp. JZ12]|uniref:hypothetical protein n=1 Tax=Arthrobacter sp. JZ12 TaxID=2654190 RepID=UPI002B4744A8|nr:hypothetical protein [Arthrobacter sp. JZ12]WRH26188.1 hypothetical protein GC088_14675 [Arthrobacter sp. JZ12]